uniref:Cytochrome P450 monooxygenase penB n=1 Tax=Penicillium thymicola TaxID=293382 RepID=PENB_PENTH|nr:RecName: Full=Cytochrome P450 monooxygenase penB; AltName: Full=Penigequinolones biosynthesis cluster protein B [Penicillium thymicola]ANY57880.1 PenB [Penicillium thymicola]
MHATYKSAIVRTGPNQVHVNDPEVYKNTFASASPFDKSRFFYSSVGVGDAIGAIMDRKQHHIRRTLLSPGLRANVILSYSPNLHKLVMNCADVMSGQARQAKSINLLRYTRSLTVDVIGDFTFGRPMGLVNEEDEMPELIRDLQDFSSQFHLWKHFPLLRKLVTAIPKSISRKWMPGFVQLREKSTAAVNEYLAGKQAGKPVSNTLKEGTFLDLLLNPPEKITSEAPKPSVLIDEGCAFITGGSDTTGFTMENATYLVLRHPSCLQKLRQELDEASRHIKDVFSPQHLLQLPFLSAVVKETLRLYTPAASPLPRTVPDDGVMIHGHFLPDGTILTHSLYLIHHNPNFFTNPKSFQPERWLGSSAKDLEQYYVPFSKGSRSCIGMTLAYHEIYTYLAIVFSRFDMELFNTTDRDMEWRDHFFVKRKGVLKVRIVRDRWSGEEFTSP